MNNEYVYVRPGKFLLGIVVLGGIGLLLGFFLGYVVF